LHHRTGTQQSQLAFCVVFFFMFISLAFVTSTALLLTVVLPRRQALLSLANTLGDAYRQEASI
jgi:hypothetical protein